MSDKLLQYLLPTLYKDDPQANLILGAAQDTTNRFKVLMGQAVNQLCAGLATWALEEWEKDLGITPPEGATTELRRAMVRAKLMRPPTMTPAQIVAIANCFIPDKDAELMPTDRPYTFRLKLPSPIPWIAEMIDSLSEAKPAHLAMEMEISRKKEIDVYVGGISYWGGRKSAGVSLPTSAQLTLNTGIVNRIGGNRTIGLSIPTCLTTKIHYSGFVCRTGKITVNTKGGF